MEAAVKGGDADLNLFTKADGSGGLTIHYDDARKTAVIDRTGMNKRFNENVGEVLEMPLDRPLEKLRIFADKCSVEIFANDGESTFTTHLYPEADEFNYTATDNVEVKIWTLAPSVKDDFVI